MAAEAVRYDGMIHGFVHLHGIMPASEAALSHCVECLRQALEII